jgi:ribokinase
VSPARVLVVGSANIDFVVSSDRLPAPGETVLAGTLLVNHGGKGANQAVAARRLGGDVRFIGCVGDDASGAAVRAQLTREGIGVEGLSTIPGSATGTALIVVDAAGRNQIAVAPGANTSLTVERLSARADDLSWPQVVLCQLEIPIPTVLWTLREARKRGATTMLNPAPVQALPRESWELVDYLTPNALEAGEFTTTWGAPGAPQAPQRSGRPGTAGSPLDTAPRSRAPGAPQITSRSEAEAAARALLARGPRVVIVTLGEEGALALEGRSVSHAPALPVQAVDTTAAGDAFNGALAVALGEGRGLGDALAFATAAAGLACTRRGAQDSLPLRAEVDAVLDRGRR